MRPAPASPLSPRELLERGYGDFINEPFLEPDEYPRHRDRPAAASPMFANLSGFLTGLLYGFTGIKLGYGAPETWPVRPVALPTGWKALLVERVWIHGEPWTLEAQAGNPAKLAPAR